MSQEAYIEFCKSLCSLQGKLTTIARESQGQAGNRKFSYADLPSIMDAIREPLMSHGFSILQEMCSVDKEPYLKTTLMHVGGWSVESTIKIDHVGRDIKEFGSAITYYRRYAISALLGIVTSEDPDSSKETIPVKEKIATLSSEQMIEINKLLDSHESLHTWFEELMRSKGINSLNEVESSKYQGIVTLINNYKKKITS